MKIVIDARIIYTSTGRYVERLVEHLQQIDHDNEYVVLLLEKDFDRWQTKAPNFTKQPANYPMYSFKEQFQFAWQLYRLRADLVHFTMPQHPLLYLKRKVITIHDLTLIDFVNRRDDPPLKAFYRYVLKPFIFRLVLRTAVKTADHIITPTKYVRQQVISRLHASPDRVTQTYEAAGVVPDNPEPIPELVGKKFILYLGNAFPYKNIRRLIDASHALKDLGYLLVLAGKPEYFYRELETHAASTKAPTFFAGFVSDAQLSWLYQHAKLYVFPSLSEGFGLPGLEAMAHGLPVAASNASCLPEVYGDGAVYFSPTDTAEMSRVIIETLQSPKRLASLRGTGSKQAKKYSWKRMAEQTLDVYRGVR